jgi:ribosomal protein L37AE/L43A
VSEDDLPHHNPCPQCGRRIDHPAWFEVAGSRVSYLWTCEECDYTFTAIAHYPAADTNHRFAA